MPATRPAKSPCARSAGATRPHPCRRACPWHPPPRVTTLTLTSEVIRARGISTPGRRCRSEVRGTRAPGTGRRRGRSSGAGRERGTGGLRLYRAPSPLAVAVAAQLELTGVLQAIEAAILHQFPGANDDRFLFVRRDGFGVFRIGQLDLHLACL